MEQQWKISVIVPVYNAQNYIRKTIASIAAQTYGNLEILLVDDGSSDRSLQICRELAEEDGRIRVLSKANGGAASARNLGIREASGEFLGFVDSDDTIEPEMYEQLLEAWRLYSRKEEGSFLVQTGRYEMSEEGERLPDDVRIPEKETFISSEEFMRDLLLCRGDSSFCTKLLPRSLLAENGKLQYGFPEGRLGEDFALHMRILPVIRGVLVLPCRGYRVLHRRGSATRRMDASSFSRAYMDIIEHGDEAARSLLPEYPGLRPYLTRFALYERLEYMLHVPVDKMNDQDPFYRSVKRYLREQAAETIRNPYLTRKNRLYLLLLTGAPRFIRKLHLFLKRGKIK